MYVRLVQTLHQLVVFQVCNNSDRHGVVLSGVSYFNYVTASSNVRHRHTLVLWRC